MASLRLTGGQRELMALVSVGLTNSDISRRLHIRESTVKQRVSGLCDKVGARNRTQLGALALLGRFPTEEEAQTRIAQWTS
jgi:DNA-binding NarL/FixJ family response regulator